MKEKHCVQAAETTDVTFHSYIYGGLSGTKTKAQTSTQSAPNRKQLLLLFCPEGATVCNIRRQF